MTKVHQYHAEEKQTVIDYMEQIAKTGAFNAGRLGTAAQILRKMINDKEVYSYLGLSGALVPAGQRQLICQCIEEKFIHAIVSTGANLTHDLLESFSLHHEILSDFSHKSDAVLESEGINRIYDVFVTTEKFEKLEKHLLSLFEEVYAQDPFTSISTHEFLRKIGLTVADPHSILATAAKANVPIYCPAITDSVLGLHIMTFFREKKIHLDPLGELFAIINRNFSAKKTGALILGGGVPKNYIFQSMLFSGRELEYAVQITMDRPEHGGLSGATLEEAVSWGKVSETGAAVVVVADVTLVFPLLVSYLKSQKPMP